MRSDGARHIEALRTSSALTTIFRQMYQREAAMITPEAVIRTLNDAGVRFVLMGAHGVGGWMSEARASQDVDVLVTRRDHRKAVQAVRTAYPRLTVQDFLVVTRFIDPATEKPVIDLMKPMDQIYQAVFRNTIAVGGTHFIPNLEMALVTKYAAMISPNRDGRKKHLDAADFMGIVEANPKSINLERLRRLGDKVYDGGGAEILRLVDDVRAGRGLTI